MQGVCSQGSHTLACTFPPWWRKCSGEMQVEKLPTSTCRYPLNSSSSVPQKLRSAPCCFQVLHDNSATLQGYIVGNGVTDPEIDGNALPSFARGKSLIPHALYTALVGACNGSYWDAQEGRWTAALTLMASYSTATLQSGSDLAILSTLSPSMLSCSQTGVHARAFVWLPGLHWPQE